MRTPTALCRPNAPLITCTRPPLALQCSADHLPRTLSPRLPNRSFLPLQRLWRRQTRRSRGMRLGTAHCRSNAPGLASARPGLAEKCLRTLAPSRPLGSRPLLYLSYTTWTLSHAQESAESAAGGAGWACGLLGVQPGVQAATGPLFLSILVVAMTLVGCMKKISRADAFFRLCVWFQECSLRACALPIAGLHGGVRVVCLWDRQKSPFHPLDRPSARGV